MGIHRNTLHIYLKLYQVDHKFSALTNRELDLLVATFKHENPDSGIRYLVGFLRKHRLKLPCHRVISSLRRVDPLGPALRARNRPTVRRRQYRVARPNALWHIDGHHKLIHWGIVIHGCVDGYSRTVCILQISQCLSVLNTNRSLVSEQATTTRHRRYWRCLWRRSWFMAFRQG
jgi:hypothetical protein